jgi:peroxygenase
MPRANLAATPEAPNGTLANNWAKDHESESVLQQHVAFFDKDGDGWIFPEDVFAGFWQLGYGAFWCFIAVVYVVLFFSNRL